MHKRMTISIDETVYEGLIRVIGRRKISQFLEALARRTSSTTTSSPDSRPWLPIRHGEREALAWSNALIGDAIDEARRGLVGGFRSRAGR